MRDEHDQLRVDLANASGAARELRRENMRLAARITELMIQPEDAEKIELRAYVEQLRKQISNLETAEMSEREQQWLLRITEANREIDRLRGADRSISQQRDRDWKIRREQVKERCSSAFLHLGLVLSNVIAPGTLEASEDELIRKALREAESECNGSWTRPEAKK